MNDCVSSTHTLTHTLTHERRGTYSSLRAVRWSKRLESTEGMWFLDRSLQQKPERETLRDSHTLRLVITAAENCSWGKTEKKLAVSNPYDWLSSVEHKRRCLAECSCCSFPYSKSEWRPKLHKVYTSSLWLVYNITSTIQWIYARNRLKFNIFTSVVALKSLIWVLSWHTMTM